MGEGGGSVNLWAEYIYIQGGGGGRELLERGGHVRQRWRGGGVLMRAGSVRSFFLLFHILELKNKKVGINENGTPLEKRKVTVNYTPVLVHACLLSGQNLT